MTEASHYLRTLAEQIATAYSQQTHPRAILLTGSAATGESDFYSDIDLIVYHDEPPSEVRLAAAREQVQSFGGSLVTTAPCDEYLLHGVECQVAHSTVSDWEQQMARVLEQFDAVLPMQKAIDGLLNGVPLHGAGLIEEWQARAQTYPDGLARAMVTTHLRFFPIWRVVERLAARDATLWYFQTLVEASQNILGVLAGLNHLYFSTFQFKRTQRFVAKMRLAPENLADRLEGLFTTPYNSAVSELEQLVAEVVALVEAHIPTVDTSPVRADLGTRDRPWAP